MESLQILALFCALVCGTHSTKPYTSKDINLATAMALQNSDPDVVPIEYSGNPLKITLGLNLIDIREVDVTRNEVEAVIWLSQSWVDKRLSWDGRRTLNHATVRGNPDRVTQIRASSDKIWIPDIAPYNIVTAPELTTPKEVVVKKDGTVIFVPGYRLRFQCSLEGFDTSEAKNCSLKIGSWTYNGNMLDFVDPQAPDTSEYPAYSRVEIVGTSAEKETLYYPCCPEPYVDIKFNFQIQKKWRSKFWFF